VLARNSANDLISGVAVQFSASSGGIAVTNGTTDATGSAVATLSTAGNATPRTITVTATAGGLTATVQVQVVSSSGAGSVVSQLSLSSNVATILTDGSTTATITALATDKNNNVVSGVPVSFSATSGALAASGTATGSAGTLTATLSTGSDSTPRTITVSGTNGTLTSTVQVAVAAPTTPTNPVYSLGYGVGTCFVADQIGGQSTSGACDSPLSTATLSAGGTTALSLTVVDQNHSLYIANPVTVTFSSPCIASGQANILPAGSQTPVTSITTTTGSINASYVANGCNGSDAIDATAVVGGQNLLAQGTLTVAAATVGSIEFVSATPTTIGLKGTGLGDTSVVVFKVLDSVGGPQSGVTVNFSVNTNVGGLTFSPTTAVSAADGTVQTVVASGTAHTSIRITATIPATQTTPAISAQSSQLTITTGLPTSNAFSIAVGAPTYPKGSLTVNLACPNVEAWNQDGVTVPFTVFLADRYGNPAPDGTAVTFTTNAGQVAGSCPTSSDTGASGGTGSSAAQCTVTWTSSNPRPYDTEANTANPNNPVILDALNQFGDGRGEVLAYATGEESYTDLAGTGYYQVGDPFVQLSEPFLDEHESGAFYSYSTTNAGVTSNIADWFLDFYGTGAYEAPKSTNAFVGITCSGGTPSAPTTCSTTTLPISASHTIIMSTGTAYIAPLQSSLTVAVGATATAYFQVLDLHGNAMPAGTQITYTFSNTNVGSVAALPPTEVGCDSNSYYDAANGTYVTPTLGPPQSGEIFSANFTASTSVIGNGTLTIYVTSPIGSVTSLAIPVSVTNSP
jgi:hypothetical protein